MGQKHMMLDGLRQTDSALSREMSAFLKPIKTGRYREGIAWDANSIRAGELLYGYSFRTENALMNVIAELRGNYDEAEKLWSDYDVKLKDFRSKVKNDVSSLESSARKTTTAVQRMQKAYSDVIATMVSEEMAQATENAERLAKAMTALSSLQSHKITLDVVDKS